jgi:hypothetical protein
MLKEVGFWASPRTDDASAGSIDELDGRPDPRQLVDESWAADLAPGEREKLAWYLTRGAFIESHELAYSFCRFDGCQEAERTPEVMGACTMTDGVFCWPEGLWHYVASHCVKPPSDFLAHIERNYDALRAARDENGDALLLWDEMERKPVSMPSGMRDWVVQYTTLGTG